MSIPFRCSSCGQEYPVTDAQAGRPVRCAFCGEFTRAGPPAGAGLAPGGRRATSLHGPDLTAATNLEPRDHAMPVPSPSYAMDYIAPPPPPPKPSPKPTPKVTSRPVSSALPPPPLAPEPFADAIPDVEPITPVPLPRAEIAIPRATTRTTRTTPTAPSASRFAKPRSGQRVGANGEKLDDVWLLLSDDVARLLSALLLVIMLAASAYGSQNLVGVITERAGIPDELSSRFSSYMWMTTAWSIVLFFIVMTPLVLGMAALACLWTKWTLPDRPFLRAAGAATLPYLLVFLIGLMVLKEQYWVAGGVALATPVVLIVALKELLGLRWSATAVTALLLLVGVPVTSLITLPVSLWVNNRAMKIAGIDPASVDAWMAEHPDFRPAARKDRRFGPENRPDVGSLPLPGGSSSNSSTNARRGTLGRSSASPSPSPNDSLDVYLSTLIPQISVSANQARNQTREQIQQAYDRYERELKPFNNSVSARNARWEIVQEQMRKLGRELKSAPSETPPPEVFTAIDRDALNVPRAAESEFANDDYFSLQGVRINPLKGAKVDVTTFLGSRTMQRWNVTSRVTLLLELKPLQDPKQQRPWVADRQVIAELATQKNLLAVIRSMMQPPTYGQIGGIGWTRTSSPVPIREHDLQYIGRLPDAWLFVSFATGTNGHSDEEIAVLDKFIQGISFVAPEGGTTFPDPVADARARARAAAAAAAAGRRSAVTPPAPAAVAAPIVLGPGDVKMLLEVIQGTGGHSWEKRDALKKLAQIKPPDAQQRDTVAPVLEQLVASDDSFLADDAADALAVWWRPQTVDVLLPLMDEKQWVSWKRGRAMKVLVKTGDKRAATPIMRWLLKDTENVVAAMIELGPVAEEEAIARLREKEPTARAGAARILSAVGTQKCLIELRRAASDPRDAGAAATARSALETVLARVKQAKAATTTTPATLPTR